MNNKPIGIFDSGLGGLSVWRELHRALPHESLLYYGDGLNCPYGDKTFKEIRGYADVAAMYFKSRGVKIVVVACNTATAAAIEYLRKRYSSMLFVGMEPAVKPAALSTQSGVIAVLATGASFKGKLFRDTVAKYAKDIEVLRIEGKGFVAMVEHSMISNDTDRSYILEAVRKVLEPAIKKGADKIVLGCTHYPFLLKEMREIIGKRKIEIINPADAVARHVSSLLKQHKLEADPNHIPEYEFHSLLDKNYTLLLDNVATSLLRDGEI